MLPLGSILFGTFQVLDANIRNNVPNGHVDTNNDSPESYVDFGFGPARSSFAGFHRLSVTRLQPADEPISDVEKPNPGAESTSTRMRLTLSCFACNPSEDKPLGSALFRTFHLNYAMLLFREGEGNVLRS